MKFLARVLPLLLLAGTCQAATFNVTNTNATGPGSLRQAMLDLNAASGNVHVIEFQTGLSGTITPQFLSSPLPPINKSGVRITGSGRDLVTLDLNSFQVLQLTSPSGGLFILEDINVVGGLGTRGGCLISEFGAVVIINRVRLANCTAAASSTERAEGGAIYTTGTTTIADSVFEDNLASGGTLGGASGGAISFQPGVSSRRLTVRRSRLARNIARTESTNSTHFVAGGAIAVIDNGALTLEQNAFVGNRVLAPTGPGSPDSIGGAVRALVSDAELDRNAFVGNEAAATGAAVALGARFPADRPLLRLSNNLFQANDGRASTTNGGAALNVNRATVRMRNSTFLFNTGGGGSNLAANLFMGGSVVLEAISNNVFDRPATGRSCGFQVSVPVPPVAAGGNNYFGDGSCTWLAGVGTQTSAPLFFTDTLQSVNLAPGVFAFTALPLRNAVITDGGSTSVSASDFALCALDDIEGNPRPFDNNGNGVANCNAGAVEKNILFPQPNAATERRLRGLIEADIRLPQLVPQVSERARRAGPRLVQ